MITLYTTGNSKTCRQAVKWLTERDISFCERRLDKRHPITKTELKKILSVSENGFDDIISYQSAIYIHLNIDIDNCTMNDAIDLLIKNPTLLKKPIILGDTKLVIGYNQQTIRCFIPEEKRTELLRKYYLNEIKSR